MGSLFTTSDGKIITDIPSGMLHLDFLNGTCIDSAGTITQMNSNLNYYNLQQVKSVAIFCSDSDAEIHVGNELSIADHQLTHIINANESGANRATKQPFGNPPSPLFTVPNKRSTCPCSSIKSWVSDEEI